MTVSKSAAHLAAWTGGEACRDLSSRREGRCEGCSWFDTCLGGGLHERLVQRDDFCWLDRQGG